MEKFKFLEKTLFFAELLQHLQDSNCESTKRFSASFVCYHWRERVVFKFDNPIDVFEFDLVGRFFERKVTVNFTPSVFKKERDEVAGIFLWHVCLFQCLTKRGRCSTFRICTPLNVARPLVRWFNQMQLFVQNGREECAASASTECPPLRRPNEKCVRHSFQWMRSIRLRLCKLERDVCSLGGKTPIRLLRMFCPIQKRRQ